MSDVRDLGILGELRPEDLGVFRKCPCLGRIWSIPKAKSELQGWVKSWRIERCWDLLQGVGRGGA